MNNSIKYGLSLSLILIIIFIYWINTKNVFNPSSIIKEGIVSQSSSMAKDVDNNKVTDILPDTTSNEISINSEKHFIDFIENLYKSVAYGGSQDASTLMSKIDRNIESMVLISGLASQALHNITDKTYNELSTAYPNMIQSQTDVIKLYELYYATTAIKVYFNNYDDINLKENPTMYNSQLNTFDKIIECLQHFHKKTLLSPKHDPIITSDDLDTKFYRKDHIDKYINEIKHYDYPVTQRIPKKAKAT